MSFFDLPAPVLVAVLIAATNVIHVAVRLAEAAIWWIFVGIHK